MVGVVSFMLHFFPGGVVPANAGDARAAGSIPGKIPWRRKWQPIPLFLPGKSHGQKSPRGYSPRSGAWPSMHAHCILVTSQFFFICTYFPYCRNLKWISRENVTGQEASLSNDESAGYCDLHMTGGPAHRMGSWCPGS